MKMAVKKKSSKKYVSVTKKKQVRKARAPRKKTRATKSTLVEHGVDEEKVNVPFINNKALMLRIVIVLVTISILFVVIYSDYIEKVDKSNDVNMTTTISTTTSLDDRLDYDEQGRAYFRRA